MVRSGYSILEMMIALGLLGILLVTSWSLLDNYRRAEERGWSLVERTQAVRVAASWIKDDLMHLNLAEQEVPPSPSDMATATNLQASPTTQNTTPNTRPNNSRRANGRSSQSVADANGLNVPVRFEGNAMGFEMVILPSTNPNAFLEKLFQNETSDFEMDSDVTSNGSGSGISASGSSSMAEANGSSSTRRPVVVPYLEISYELKQTGEAIGNTVAIPIFELTRRESLDVELLVEPDNSNLTASNEPVLTAEDLYRLSDEERTQSSQTLQQNRLTGLADAQFWYCDGTNWSTSWSARGGRFPTAIALTFDFAPRSGVRPLVEQSLGSLSDLSGSPSDSLFNSSVDSGLSPSRNSTMTLDEPVLEGSGQAFELLQRDVKLVMKLLGHPNSLARKNPTGAVQP